MSLELRRRIAREPLRVDDDERAHGRARRTPTTSAEARWPTTMFLDAQLGFVDDMLHYSDRVSMAHSLEVRVPFLDHEVVELAATIPPALKVRGATTKHLVKRIARGLVPDQDHRQAKDGLLQSRGGLVAPGAAARPGRRVLAL